MALCRLFRAQGIERIRSPGPAEAELNTLLVLPTLDIKFGFGAKHGAGCARHRRNRSIVGPFGGHFAFLKFWQAGRQVVGRQAGRQAGRQEVGRQGDMCFIMM